MRRVAAMLLLGLCLAVAAGCGGSSDPSSGGSSTTGGGEPGPALEVPGGPPPKKLEVRNLKTGSGPPARKGDRVSVHYIGKLWGGAPYSNSWKYGHAPSFTLGNGELIVGFDRGLRGMRAGGRRELLVPRRFDTFPGAPLTAGARPLVFLVYMFNVHPPG